MITTMDILKHLFTAIHMIEDKILDFTTPSNKLVKMLQEDLVRERQHMEFYLQSAVLVRGLHREELSEFFMEEAKSELGHVAEFCRHIVYLGGLPHQDSLPIPLMTDPIPILEFVVKMEQEVADHYAQRLIQTHAMAEDPESGVSPASAMYLHVFYEDQISDSQKTAWEVAQMLEAKINS